jgi:hypothetical protein
MSYVGLCPVCFGTDCSAETLEELVESVAFEQPSSVTQRCRRGG